LRAVAHGGWGVFTGEVVGDVGVVETHERVGGVGRSGVVDEGGAGGVGGSCAVGLTLILGSGNGDSLTDTTVVDGATGASGSARSTSHIRRA